MPRRLSAFALSLAVLFGAPLQAQQHATDPHADAASAQHATAADDGVTASDAAKQEPSLVERLRRLARRTQIVDRITGTVDGWYPRLGGMTRGSGLVLGPGYRTHALDGRVLLDVSAALSTRFYKAADAHIRWMQTARDRVEVWTDLRLEDYPQEDFYGMGATSSRDTRTSYDFASLQAGARVLANLPGHVQLGAVLGVMNPSINHGTDPDFPSVEQLFTDAQAPGLAAQPNYLTGTLFIDMDTRQPSGNPQGGGHYRVAFGSWNDHTLHQYDFNRLDVNTAQYVALTPSRRHVVSGRFGLSTLNNTPGNRVPFYFFPYVGGNDTVRSLNEFRFRDENAIWLSVEYTWTPAAHVSLAGFADAGKVTHTWDAVSLAGLTPAYGVGIRVHTATQRLVRLDVATGGGEGWRAIVKLGPSF
jgi:hypothetical protein